MRTVFWRRIGALALAVSLAAAICAQSSTQLMTQAQDAYNRKEYAKSADLYLKAYRQDSKMLLALYNAACSLALSGQKEQAIATLQELADRGYNQVDQLKQDTDFESVRNDPRWEKVVARVEENAKKNPPRPLWKKPFTLLTEIPPVSELEAKLGKETSAVWLEGDVLTFLHRSSAPTVQLSGGIQEPMTHVPNTDLWIARIKMQGWEKAIVSYVFIDGSNTFNFKVWRGSEAASPQERADPLRGQLISRKIHSDALGEDRDLSIYLPPNAPKSGLPAVFMADGFGAKQFAQVLEPLILAHKVRPCAIVGIPSGMYQGDRNAPYDPTKDLRAREYVPGQDADRFEKHMRFFTQEVGAYVAKEFGISTRREDRAVTGYSNGGAFSAAVAFRMPDFFGTAIPLSLGVPPEDPVPASPPRMFFAAGTLESFSRQTQIVYELVKKSGATATMDLYVAGHDPEMWETAFAKVMPRVFPPR